MGEPTGDDSSATSKLSGISRCAWIMGEPPKFARLHGWVVLGGQHGPPAPDEHDNGHWIPLVPYPNTEMWPSALLACATHAGE